MPPYPYGQTPWPVDPQWGHGAQPPAPAPIGDDGFPVFGPGSIPALNRRAAARVLDYALAFVVYFLAVLPLVHVDAAGKIDLSHVPAWLALVAPAADFVYETIAVAVFGTTVGKRLFGMRIEGPDGGRPGWQRAATRSLLPNLLGAISQGVLLFEMVVYASAIWNPLRQGWHDRLAGTVVVSTR